MFDSNFVQSDFLYGYGENLEKFFVFDELNKAIVIEEKASTFTSNPSFVWTLELCIRSGREHNKHMDFSFLSRIN